MKGVKGIPIALILVVILLLNLVLALTVLQAAADEYVGGSIVAVYEDSWMEEQPEIPLEADKLIQFNRDQQNNNAYHLGDTNVNVWITLRNTDSWDSIYVGQASLISNHPLFTPNDDEDDGHTIPAGGTYTFQFTIDIGTIGAVNILYLNALTLDLGDLEQPMGVSINDESFDFDIYVSSIFDPDANDEQVDIHENLSDIQETDAHPDFEPGEDIQEGKIELTNHASFSISEVVGDLADFPPGGVTISGGGNVAVNPGPVSANGGILDLKWNFDIWEGTPPDYYVSDLEISYNRSDTGMIITENFRPTGLYVAPITIATGPVGGPINEPEINVTYSMTGNPPDVDMYCTTNTTAPYNWTFMGTDFSPDGDYNWSVPTDGSYGWIAISENETVPNSTVPPEASYYIYDGTPPGVESTNPADGAIEVATERDPVITFDEAVNATSFLYTVEPDPGGLSEYWGADNRSVTILHTEYLVDTRYWVNITSLTDTAGNNLDPLPFSIHFDTISIYSTATSTEPTGGPSNISEITISYTTTHSPAGVELYYTTNTTSPYQWILIGSDRPPDGSFPFTIPGDGSYGWFAVATDEIPPISTDPPEAGYYEYDGTPPGIAGVEPDSGATGIALDREIVISFSEEMDKSTFQYTIEPDPGGLSESWNAEGDSMTISHSAFTSATWYWVNITGGRDLAGNDLDTLPYSFYFDTIVLDLTPPSIAASTPSGSNETPDTTIVITFSEPMDTESVESAFSFTDGTTTWDISDGTASWNATNETLTFVPTSALSYETTYTVTIGSNARDMAGNTLTTHTWSFTVMQEPDDPSPSIAVSSYSRNENHKTYSIMFNFSEPMNKTSVKNAFTVSPNATVLLTWLGPDRLEVTTTGELEPGTKYAFTIGTGARDEAGNPLAEPYTLSFTTEENTEEESPILETLLFLVIAVILILIVVMILLLAILRKRKHGRESKEIEGEEATPESEDREAMKDGTEEKGETG